MGANIFGRYVWLIEQFRCYGRLTYEEVNNLWRRSGLSYGDDLAIRTFHNHRKAIFDIFEVDIVCDIKGGYKYYIDRLEDLEKDDLRIWLISSYTAMNQIQADRMLKERIIFEYVPSGDKWLSIIIEAMRSDRVLNIAYQSFRRSEPSHFDIEPYYLKIVKRRWYVLARNPYYSSLNKQKSRGDGDNYPHDVFSIYALDRILGCRILETSFSLKEDFDANEYFHGCCGVLRSTEEPIRIVLKAYYDAPDYLRTLPIHESQQELVDMNDDNATYFELTVCPTFDFYQLLLSQADQIEVLKPKSVRMQMNAFAKKLLSYYNEGD
ncbi:MAG: WYL domain-containing protein [Porphyromonadaceae bacterium]|nr:WYL domain-containing protein [Porphyromonadaceae bacterium]